MRGRWHSLTVRGRVVLVTGLVLLVGSYLGGQRDVLRIAILLCALPVLAVLLTLRTRYQLSCARGLAPARISVDGTATVVLRLHNLARLPSGVLLVQDPLPWQLGSAARFVVAPLPHGASRDVRYELTAPLRGAYEIGPLTVQVADAFGLCRSTRRFSATDTVTVVPRVVPLPAVPLGGDWSGLGDSRARAIASSGDEDVLPRQYRTGDELRRVHWKSTARAGELMVRQEERPFRTCATVLLDTRAAHHRGEGAASTFEWAVTVAASVACHLARRGYVLRLIDLDGRPLETASHLAVDGVPGAEAETVVLDALAVVGQTSGSGTAFVDPNVRERSRDGLMVLVAADLGVAAADAVARLRRGRMTGLALLADAAQWPGPRPATVTGSVPVLAAAGWRTAVAAPGDDVATLWRGLSRGHATAGSAGR